VNWIRHILRFPLRKHRPEKPRPVLQLGPVDCGPANLRALCLSSGVHVDNATIRTRCGMTQAGSSLSGLCEAAKSLGFDAQMRQLDLYDLRDHADCYLPAIVVLKTTGNLLHFVTVHAFKKNRVVVMDPAVGMTTLDIEHLRIRMHRTTIPFKWDALQEEEASQENRDELFRQLVNRGVSESDGVRWLNNHSLFYIDDCVKYVDMLEAKRAIRALDSPREILHRLLEDQSYVLPAGFGTTILSEPEQNTSAVTGTVVLVVKGSPVNIAPGAIPAGPRRRLFELIWRYRSHWAPFSVLDVLGSAVGLSLTMLGGMVIASLDVKWPPLLTVLVAGALAQLYISYLGFVSARGTPRLIQAITLRLKSGLLLKLHRVPDWFLHDRAPGELLTRVGETVALPAFILAWGTTSASASLTLAGAIVLLSGGFWPFLLISAGGMLLATLVNEIFARRLARLSRDVLEANVHYNSKFVEALRGLRALRLVDAHDAVFFEMDELASCLVRVQYRQQDWLLLQSAISGVLGTATTLALTVAAFMALQSGAVTPAIVVTSFSLIGLARNSLNRLLSLRQGVEGAGIILDRYEEFIDAPECAVGGNNTPRTESSDSLKSRVTDGIVLRDVSVVYGRRRVLSNVCLHLEPGRHVCMLGPSGAGKTTLLEVLAGILSPASGKVSNHATSSGVGCQRGGTILVEQEPVLFDDSLRANILVGEQDPGGGALLSACEAAGLSDFVFAHPDGFDRRIGGRAARLSGGEARRVCLARALVRQPRVLLLDESLGALDWLLRCDILERLRRDRPDLTIVISTHDPTDAFLCDEVILVDRGEVVETGEVRDLLANEGSAFVRMLGEREKVA